MITASKIKKLKKDKTRLIRTVAIAADKLSDKKREQGTQRGDFGHVGRIAEGVSLRSVAVKSCTGRNGADYADIG